jgi:tripartite-type tricarboxylate transporter receptor subunit TctC
MGEENMPCLTRRVIIALPGAAFIASQARADTSYPNRTVRTVVPFPPGGTTDVIGRIVAESLGSELAQPFYIDNRGGAGGTLGADVVAKAKPDGYTLLVFHSGLTYGPALFKHLNYDVLKDFTPISLLGVAPSVLVVTPSLPFRSVADLIAAAKQKPGEINYGSAGVGSSGHLAVELFQSVTGVKVTHVPFRGGAPSVMAVIGGQVQFMIETAGSIMQQIQSSTLRPLAVTSEARLPELPSVPTMREAELSDYVYSTWYGLLGPAAMDPVIVETLNKACAKAAGKPDVKAKLANAGIDATTSSSTQFAKIIRDDLDKWTKIIHAAGIEPQ